MTGPKPAWRTALEQIATMPYGFDHDAGNVIDNMQAIAAAALAEPGQVCTWTLHGNDSDTNAWESSCGDMWQFMEGGPAENRVRFCHGCGKLVVVVELVLAVEDDDE